MTEMTNAICYVVKEWKEDAAKALFEAIDATPWPNWETAYNTDTMGFMISTALNDTKLTVEAFSDGSLAVYFGDMSFTDANQNIPAIVKTFMLVNGVEIPEIEYESKS